MLLESTVYILGSSEDKAKGLIHFDGNKKVQIKSWSKNDGSTAIPVFTSLDVLKASIDKEEDYLAFSARSLFEFTRGSWLVLNPKSSSGKEFSPQEIDALLSGGVNRLPQSRTVPRDTQVLLGQPTSYPTVLTESLARFFVNRPNVRAAYLALMHDPKANDKPNFVVGLEVDGNFQNVLLEAGAIAGDVMPGQPIDFAEITKDDAGLSAYMRKTAPFYKRDWKAKVRSFLQGQDA